MRLGDHHRCHVPLSTLAGLAFVGCGLDAYAQDPTGYVPVLPGLPGADPSTALLVDLVGRGGLPLALVWLAWQARGWLTSLTITVELSERSVDRLADKLRNGRANTEERDR